MPPAKPVIDTATTGDATRRLLSSASVPYLLVAAGVIAAIVLLGVEIDHHISAIETGLEALGPWSLVAFVLLYVLLTSLLLPESVLSLMAGAMFGMVSGLAVVVVASLIAAALQFVLARRNLKATIERTLNLRCLGFRLGIGP